MLTFNVPEFLARRCNNGHTYRAEDAYCLKGNFAVSCGVDTPPLSKAAAEVMSKVREYANSHDGEYASYVFTLPLEEVALLNETVTGIAFDQAMAWRAFEARLQYQLDLSSVQASLLRRALDRAESIHLSGRPQYAKLYLLRAIRLLKLLPPEAIATIPDDYKSRIMV